MPPRFRPSRQEIVTESTIKSHHQSAKERRIRFVPDTPKRNVVEIEKPQFKKKSNQSPSLKYSQCSLYPLSASVVVAMASHSELGSKEISSTPMQRKNMIDTSSVSQVSLFANCFMDDNIFHTAYHFIDKANGKQ